MSQVRVKFLALLLASASAMPMAAVAQTTQCVASAAAQGTSDAITIASLPCALTTNLLILSVAANNTTTTPTLQPLGLPAQTIIHQDGTALLIGDLVAGGRALLNPTGSKWILLNPIQYIPSVGTSGATIPLNNGNNTHSGTETFTGTVVLPSTTATVGVSSLAFLPRLSADFGGL